MRSVAAWSSSIDGRVGRRRGGEARHRRPRAFGYPVAGRCGMSQQNPPTTRAGVAAKPVAANPPTGNPHSSPPVKPNPIRDLEAAPPRPSRKLQALDSSLRGLTSQHCPVRPRDKAWAAAAQLGVAPGRDRGVLSGTSKLRKNSYPSGDWRGRARWWRESIS